MFDDEFNLLKNDYLTHCMVDSIMIDSIMIDTPIRKIAGINGIEVDENNIDIKITKLK